MSTYNAHDECNDLNIVRGCELQIPSAAYVGLIWLYVVLSIDLIGAVKWCTLKKCHELWVVYSTYKDIFIVFMIYPFGIDILMQ